MSVVEQQENVRFARTVRRYPCLYDYTNTGYSSRTETEIAWREISADFNAPVKDCKLRWKNIRTVFRRHLFGSVGPAPKKEYYLSEELQFLLPLLRLPKKHQDGTIELEDDEQDIAVMMEMEPTDTESDDPSASRTPSEPQVLIESYQEPQTDPQEQQMRTDFIRRRKPRETATEVVKSNYNHNRASAAEAEYGGYVYDDLTMKSDELFLLSLKDDMRRMNPIQKRKFKRRIFDIIDETMESDNQQSVYQEPEESTEQLSIHEGVKIENETYE
ncbi:uncharacterized protein LOC134202409 [Armigeres subalbatus]|uniref:uncharacterized protein LOC134202409 n=1 Tax=Armigeres subalbatus TaxID=124917 RepID=UPI002ED078AF